MASSKPSSVASGALAEILPGPSVEHDGYLVTCLPDSDLDGLKSLHFAVKRTCAYDIDGRAEPIRHQARLVASDSRFEDAAPFGASVHRAAEGGPPFGGTDVAIVAHAHAPGGEAQHFFPAVQIGAHRHRILAIGDRVAVVDRRGRAHISRPRPLSVRPIRYEYAYGGVDRHHPGGPLPCPGNPLGVGFLLGPADGAEPHEAFAVMPNFEDADRPYDRDTLVLPATRDREVRGPAGFGWVPAHWEPRALYAGMPESTRSVWTLVHGDTDPEGERFKAVDPRFWRAANPGLQLPALSGDEPVTLDHMHPRFESVRFRLPGLSPTLAVAINGDALQRVPLELSMVHIEADSQRVELVWRGSLPKPAALEGLHTLKRLEYEVDGRPELPAALVGQGFPIELMRGELPPGTVDLSALDRLREVPS